MSFGNLFTTLPSLEVDAKSSGQPAFTRRNEADQRKRSRGRKRKTLDEEPGPSQKKHCYGAQTARPCSASGDSAEATHHHMRNPYSEYASGGFSRDMIHDHSRKAGHSNTFHKGQNYKNGRNLRKQREQMDGQRNQHQQDRVRTAMRGGRHQARPTLRKSGGAQKYMKDKKGKCPRSMSEEFKDQNALLVDGRLLCRHFLWGRCIKGDDCQLEHVTGHNDLVKELCKFYVQGSCTKGELCPYMHKSFPCKFFHRNGKCSRGADCRFSHEPLNEVTKQLFDAAIKQEKDLYELAKEAERESPGQPANVESEMSDTHRTADVFLQPLRFSFYNSTDTKTEQQALVCPTGDGGANARDSVPPLPPDATQPPSWPSVAPDHIEPVDCSVESVLELLPAPRTHECAPPSYSYCSSDPAQQSQVSYSVDAVLGSFKAGENSPFNHTATPPPAQSVSYTPKMFREEVIVPPLRSKTQNKEALHLANSRKEENKPQEEVFNCPSSLQAGTGPNLKACPDLPPVPLDHKKQDGNVPGSLKPAQRASDDVKPKLLPLGVTCSATCKSEGVDRIGPTNHIRLISRLPCQTSASKRPEQLKPHLPVPASDSQASIKLVCPSLGFTEFEAGAAAPVEPASRPVKSDDSANSASCGFAPNQLTEIHLQSKETQSGLKPGSKHSVETTAECSSDLVVECENAPKTPFKSLFASSFTDTLQSVDISPPQHSSQSRCLHPQASSAAKATDKTPSSSFLSLFAAPLPCLQSQPDYSGTCRQSSDNTTVTDSKYRTSHLETSVPHQVRTEEIFDVPRSPSLSPASKIKRSSSTEPRIPPSEQLLDPNSPDACGSSPCTSHSHEEQPDISSKKAGATANSALKTLFLSLSPYKE